MTSRKPAANAPDAARAQRLQEKVTPVLDRQSTAMRTGDLAGFLAPTVDDGSLRADLSRRFTSLRALELTKWTEAVWGTPTLAVDGSWTVPVRLQYCFVTPDCTLVPATVSTSWRESGGTVTMTAFGTVAPGDLGPRPWEISDLRVVVGKRVVFATTQRYASKLSAMSAAAERAATAADAYAKWGPKPSRYFVYLAGPGEWGSWYGIPQAAWAAGYAIPITDRSSEVVLNGAQVGVSEIGGVLRHEFTHVVTLAGLTHTYPGTWWFMEGLAEYVRAGPGSLSGYDGLAEGRRYVRSGNWSGDIELDEPAAGASTSDANGRYAVAYLAVRRMADRFGEAKMLALFAAIVRNGVAPEQAAPSVLGTSWSDVSADAVRYVRRSLG